MGEIFSLGPRLSKCAEYVRPDSKFVDIGSDHGYLPIWLKLNNRISSAIAADIGEGPLSAARRNAGKYRCELKTVLSDGFEKIDPQEVEDAVIAGMGGGLMIAIMSAAHWLKENDRHIILQPMTMIPELRQWLSEEGYSILKEEAVVDEKKVYSVMLVTYDPENSELKDMELYMGKLRPTAQHSDTYAQKTLKKLSDKVKGHSHRGEMAEAKAAEALMAEIYAEYLTKEEI